LSAGLGGTLDGTKKTDRQPESKVGSDGMKIGQGNHGQWISDQEIHDGLADEITLYQDNQPTK